MRTYLIHGDQITVASSPNAAPERAIVVRSPKDLDAKRFPLARLARLWRSLPGVEPINRFASLDIGRKRLWRALKGLPSSGRRDSKQAKVIALLRRTEGASIDELTKATGWQRHTVRGVLAGAIKKKLGLPVTAVRDGSGTKYRIAT